MDELARIEALAEAMKKGRSFSGGAPGASGSQRKRGDMRVSSFAPVRAPREQQSCASTSRPIIHGMEPASDCLLEEGTPEDIPNTRPSRGGDVSSFQSTTALPRSTAFNFALKQVFCVAEL
jgi:hypothetical protein